MGALCTIPLPAWTLGPCLHRQSWTMSCPSHLELQKRQERETSVNNYAEVDTKSGQCPTKVFNECMCNMVIGCQFQYLTIRLICCFLGLTMSIVIIFSIPIGRKVVVNTVHQCKQSYSKVTQINSDLRWCRLLTVVVIISLIGRLCIRFFIWRLEEQMD